MLNNNKLVTLTLGHRGKILKKSKLFIFKYFQANNGLFHPCGIPLDSSRQAEFNGI